MNTGNRIKLGLLLLALVFIFPQKLWAQPEVASEAAILMDMNNGQVLYQKNSDIRMFPASTTKILTALVVIKNGNFGDRVTVSRQAVMAGGSSVGLQEGEVLKLGDLLQMLLLSSANDAAVALAEHIGGSVEQFAAMMNDEARAIGATNSHFINPHGLHDPEHYTTAGDLALIAREAMKNPVFREIVGTYHFRTERFLPKSVDGIPQVDFVNHNKLLRPGYRYQYQGVTGVKTGYTDEARQCLVASAVRNQREMLAVALKSESAEVYQDCVALLDYGFNGFLPVVLAEQGTEVEKSAVKNGVEGDIGVLAEGKLYYNVPAGSNLTFDKKINIDNIIAPVEKGQKVGSMSFLTEGKAIGSSDLIADRKVYKKSFFRWWYGLTLVIPLFLLIRVREGLRRRRYYMRKNRWK
ncbi:MAG: D-alanyl-D-alanine carboxypeptidase family protein [Desulfocucumaceae bacterium]